MTRATETETTGVVRRRRPGGRTAKTGEAVHAACLRLLATRGVRGFGMEELAAEAGVHKTTLYRRWVSMAVLLGDVAAELIGGDIPVPDSGTLEGDLRAIARGIAGVLRDPVKGPAMTALFTAPPDMTEVAAVIAAFWAERLTRLAPVVDRAVARGDIPDSDVSLVFECLGAPLYYRLLLTRQPIDRAAIERAVQVTLTAIGAGQLRR